MTGREALVLIVNILERINPDDYYCILCRPLLRILRPLVEDPPHPGHADEKVIDVVD